VQIALAIRLSYTLGSYVYSGGGHMGRIKVNLTLDADVADMARALGLNMSRLAEAAIVEAAKAERNRLWRTQNQTAIAAYADEVARDGMPLTPFRSF
jgi:antitoxin CcdA